MKYNVETLPNCRIAYIRRVGPYGPANVEVMERLKKWAKDQNILKSATLLAIPQDNPETTLPENCRFDACIILSKEAQIDGSICEDELAGGKYLIYEVEHTAEAIQKAYAHIFASLPETGYVMDQKPIFERYSGENSPYCDICVPVK